MVAGIVLILMGVILFIILASNIYSVSYFQHHMFELYPMILLGVAFTGGGIFVLVSKKGK